MRLHTLFFAATLIASSSAAFADPITKLFVFGDSLSDNGNLSALSGGAVPVPPYALGRASNGPVAVEYLAQYLGLPPLLPSLLGGTNFAFIGAATGDVPFPTLADPSNTADNVAEVLGFAIPPTGMRTAQFAQVAQYLLANPGAIDPGALFFVWGGANDLAINPGGATAVAAANNIGLLIDALYGAGARRFLVPSLPDLGKTPAAGAAGPGLTALSMTFNDTLAENLTARQGLSGIQISRFDTFTFLNAVIDNPAAYDLVNVTQPCVAGSPLAAVRLCSVDDEDGYLFWDGSHPTTAGHKQLGAAFATVLAEDDVPEPVTGTLIALGIAAVTLRRRRAA